MASKKNTQAPESSTNEHVTVEVLDDRKVVHVHSEHGPIWDLTQWKQDTTEEPRVSVASLSKRVAQSPKKLRQTARGLIDENFAPFERYSESTGRTPGFLELYLNEAEALYLCTKLRTAPAKAITWEMIRVYMKARRGLLPQQSIDPVQLSNALLKLDRLEASNRELQAEHRQGMIDLARQNQNLQAQIIQLQNSHESGVIGARLAKTEINSPLSDYARIMARVDLTQGFRAHCSRAHVELRDELEYPAGQGADWRYLPREKFGKAQRIVRKMLSRAIKALNAIQATESKKASARQSSFKYDN